MLNRLSFELAERQRYNFLECSNHVFRDLMPFPRLDTKKKELLQQREELIKQKKAITTVGESVKTQIDNVVKVIITGLYPNTVLA
jgi:THO complex subunit 5